MRNISVTWRGREVQGPIKRKLVVAFILLYTAIALPIGLVVVLPIALVIGTLIHPFLVVFGRKGVYRTEGRSFVIKLDREAFRRA